MTAQQRRNFASRNQKCKDYEYKVYNQKFQSV